MPASWAQSASLIPGINTINMKHVVTSTKFPNNISNCDYILANRTWGFRRADYLIYGRPCFNLFSTGGDYYRIHKPGWSAAHHATEKDINRYIDDWHIPINLLVGGRAIGSLGI